MPDLIPYYDLPEAERNAIYDWVLEHGLNPDQIPAATPPTYNPATGDWTFTRFVFTDDGKQVAVHGEPATVKTTITPTRPLHWRIT